MPIKPTRAIEPDASSNANWTSREAYLLALVCLLSGLALGYLFRGSSPPGSTAGVPAPSAVSSVPGGAPAAGGAALHSAEAVEPLAAPLLAAVKANPGNVQALVELGNLYYDHHVYPQAIEYYRRALEFRPDDPNVRTDLGTAYWYSGFADQAIAEYTKVLAKNSTFAPAMLNTGIVRMEGLKDYAGAVAAWEKLLATNPQHPERGRVEGLIAQTRARMK